jgi:gluconate 5-dehydrogenase
MSVKQFFDLSGKVAVVTGGSRGLGLQMALALGEMGAKLALTARKADELALAEARLQGLGIEVLVLPNDLSRPDCIPVLVDSVLARYGTINILVNNAGATWSAAAEAHPLEAWRKVMALNIDAMFLLSQEVGRRCFLPQGSGKIINIASIAGLAGNPPGMTTLAYNTSKGAVLAFTRALASEWGPHNINVNAICPGFFPTKMSAALLQKLEAEVLAATPLGRLGGDADLMGAVVFLASEASRHMTGQQLILDGGHSTTL